MHDIRLSDGDLTALKDLIGEYRSSKDKNLQKSIAALSRALDSVEVLEAGDVDLIDVVALNTSVRFRTLASREDKEYLLVQPKLECKALGRLSIFSDLGISLLGYKKGETVRVREIDGKQYSIQIIDVHPVNLDWIKRLEEQS